MDIFVETLGHVLDGVETLAVLGMLFVGIVFMFLGFLALIGK